MSIPTPVKFFLTSGSSEGYTPLNAFDAALLNAGVGDCNLVRLSSIVPPSCKQVEYFKPAPGSLTPVAYASMNATIPGEIIAAAVACAIPVDGSLPGVVMEYSARGSAASAESIVRDMAEEAFRIRDREIRDVFSISVEHEVINTGSVFAGVIFGY